MTRRADHRSGCKWPEAHSCPTWANTQIPALSSVGFCTGWTPLQNRSQLASRKTWSFTQIITLDNPLLSIFCTVIASSMCYFCSLLCSNMWLVSRSVSWGKKQKCRSTLLIHLKKQARSAEIYPSDISTTACQMEIMWTIFWNLQKDAVRLTFSDL